MSDAMSDALKPDFWEAFFSNPEYLLKAIKKQKNLFGKISEYNSLADFSETTSKLSGVNHKKDLLPLKKEIMMSLLKIYGEERYYNYMFLEDWRFPSDYYLKELMQQWKQQKKIK